MTALLRRKGRTIAISVVVLCASVYGGILYQRQADTAVTLPRYAFDVSDEKALVGFASDVFIGRVVEQTGSEGLPTSDPGEQIARTQFSVEVLRSIKGTQGKVVTVSQDGGYEFSIAGRYLSLVDGDPLLRPGETVVFVTRRIAQSGWYTIVASRHGDVRVSSAQHLEQLVATYTQAYREQKRFDDHGNPVN